MLQSDTLTNTWDAANRLTGTERDGVEILADYNGIGDRVVRYRFEGPASLAIPLALDVAAGLPEVIQAGTSRYLHLPGVIVAQNDTETRYLLSDGLGSVRQATDETGQVVSYHQFDPYGNPVAGEGDPYGFTGEWWEDEVSLLHLRARWYTPGTGTFLSRDPVESEPAYQYVRGNVVNAVDPSGLCPPGVPVCRGPDGRPIDQYYRYGDRGDSLSLLGPNPWFPVVTPPTPRERAYDIFRSGSDNVTGLIRLFETDGLPGCTAQERLDWILLVTTSHPGSYIQFGSVVPQDGDSGFRKELADGNFYGNVWADPGPSKQMGHFLTAVALGNDPAGAYYQAYIFEPSNLITDLSPPLFTSYFVAYHAQRHALDLIVGHEMIGDQQGRENIRAIYQQYHAATSEARSHFLKAVDYDTEGLTTARDQELRAILVSTNPRFEIEDAIEGRAGNSIQDLRNSVKGWRFGQEIRQEIIYTHQEAADWLRKEIYDPSRTR